MSKKCTKTSWIQLIANDNAGRTSTFKVLIAVVISFTTCKSYNLSSYVSAEFLLACASLDHNICFHLVVSESYKLQWNNISSLMKKLIERVLSVSSWFSENHRSCHIIYWFSKTVYRFTVGFHIQLLKVCRKTAQRLRIWKNCCTWISQYVSFIKSDQCIQHCRVLKYVFVCSKFILCCCSIQELCKYFWSKCQR